MKTYVLFRHDYKPSKTDVRYFHDNYYRTLVDRISREIKQPTILKREGAKIVLSKTGKQWDRVVGKILPGSRKTIVEILKDIKWNQ